MGAIAHLQMLVDCSIFVVKGEARKIVFPSGLRPVLELEPYTDCSKLDAEIYVLKRKEKNHNFDTGLEGQLAKVHLTSFIFLFFLITVVGQRIKFG